MNAAIIDEAAELAERAASALCTNVGDGERIRKVVRLIYDAYVKGLSGDERGAALLSSAAKLDFLDRFGADAGPRWGLLESICGNVALSGARLAFEADDEIDEMIRSRSRGFWQELVVGVACATHRQELAQYYVRKQNAGKRRWKIAGLSFVALVFATSFVYSLICFSIDAAKIGPCKERVAYWRSQPESEKKVALLEKNEDSLARKEGRMTFSVIGMVLSGMALAWSGWRIAKAKA